ncbi:MAG TPA: metal-dependent hydrolase [Candidatus Bathyarchaeia archaeon]|nr:metal-dependent hydrolase [Candidatus Bathyarchaeia archaeon]
MPTVLSHPAVPLALGVGLGRGVIATRLLLAGVVVSALPDLDVLAFQWGVPYGSALGHRGFTHSLCMAAAVALVGAACSRWLGSAAAGTFAFLFSAMASHGLLDTLTDGGRGVALLWPWTGERFFAPWAWRVIEVSPIGITPFLSARGLAVLESELRWIWLPALAVSLILVGARRALGGSTHP